MPQLALAALAPAWPPLLTARLQEGWRDGSTANASQVARPGDASFTQRGEFEQFFLHHEAAISGYLWRMTGNEQTACDLCQETFLRAWQRFEQLREYERPGAWLWRVATNLALQHLRRRAAPVGAATRLDEASGPNASDPSGRFAERDLVRETLMELSPRARALLVLREVYGLSGEEVGETLKMSREAVKVGLWRARAQFRAAYLRGEEKGEQA